MKSNKNFYQNIFLGVILVFSFIGLYSTKFSETPRFILFFGRFHPLLLHLPIGALVVTFFIDILGRIQKNYSENTVRNLLGFSSIFSIITSFLGYFLSLEGGYPQDTLDLHFYTGILTAILITILFYISTKTEFKSKKIFLPLFIASLISISIAGHYGSVLTHGDSFLTEYAKALPKEKTIEVVDSLKLYNNVIVKILDKKCTQCHNATKQKGELSLITKSGILKGGKEGLAVVANNTSKSLLYTRMLLPISNN